jgi:hypothetical protein
MLRVLAIGLIFILSRLSSASGVDDSRIKLFLWLDRAEVKADFRHHVLERHDMRFVGVYGYGAYVPGVNSAMEARLVRQDRVRYIEGTSDNITSPEYGRLVEKAERYAERYNAMLLHYLRGHPNA